MDARTFVLEVEQGAGGRWRARIVGLPDVQVDGASEDEVVARATAVALRAAADEIERRERAAPELLLLFKRSRPNSDGPLLSERLRDIDTPAGHARVAAGLASGPFPHFAAVPGRPGLLIKIDRDGTRTVGRFVNREFVPCDVEDKSKT
jgi:hypothetical protein